jgi:predicted AAA+ superfamily ATPase
MVYINRLISSRLDDLLGRGKSVLLLGARQTGKTTLLGHLAPVLAISFLQPRVRQQYELDPSVLADEVIQLNKQIKCPLVVVDEVQKVPLIMDVVQDLIDKKLGQFVLTGSSARKLKHGQSINLLPGRVMPLHLDPFMMRELTTEKKSLADLLIYGSLPSVLTTSSTEEKEEILEAYVTLYLEEEIRREAVVRNIVSFARFLMLAASESGNIVNYAKISQDIGVARTTIVDYYQILEDCLVAERVEPITHGTTRHKLSKANKYLLFDLGVRRLAAREGRRLPEKTIGHLFEQFIGLELLRYARILSSQIKLRYWRDHEGPEVDWVLEFNGIYIPIEVKYTDKPTIQDAKHLTIFMEEYQNSRDAFIVCRVPRPRKIADRVVAIGWEHVDEVFQGVL